MKDREEYRDQFPIDFCGMDQSGTPQYREPYPYYRFVYQGRTTKGYWKEYPPESWDEFKRTMQSIWDKARGRC